MWFERVFCCGVLVAGLAACGDDASSSAQCTEDDACLADEMCEDGICVMADVPGPEVELIAGQAREAIRVEEQFMRLDAGENDYYLIVDTTLKNNSEVDQLLLPTQFGVQEEGSIAYIGDAAVTALLTSGGCPTNIKVPPRAEFSCRMGFLVPRSANITLLSYTATSGATFTDPIDAFERCTECPNDRGRCVDFETDLFHCGQCDNYVGDGYVCEEGVAVCPEGGMCM
ncbi:MAG: hypothetical protein AAFX99_31780 [Myxococcota bacterium]